MITEENTANWFICSLCGKIIRGEKGKDPSPLREDGYKCCEDCYNKMVLPARVNLLAHVIVEGGKPDAKS